MRCKLGGEQNSSNFFNSTITAPLKILPQARTSRRRHPPNDRCEHFQVILTAPKTKPAHASDDAHFACRQIMELIFGDFVRSFAKPPSTPELNTITLQIKCLSRACVRSLHETHRLANTCPPTTICHNTDKSRVERLCSCFSFKFDCSVLSLGR